jgi:hypothetical protein
LGLTQPQLALAAGVGMRFIVDLAAGKLTLRLENILRVLHNASSLLLERLVVNLVENALKHQGMLVQVHLACVGEAVELSAIAHEVSLPHHRHRSGHQSGQAGAAEFSVSAMQDDGQPVTARGNFETVAFASAFGPEVKNTIILPDDGMGSAQSAAAHIVKGGYAQGKAIEPLAMDDFPAAAMVKTASLNSVVIDNRDDFFKLEQAAIKGAAAPAKTADTWWPRRAR